MSWHDLSHMFACCCAFPSLLCQGLHNQVFEPGRIECKGSKWRPTALLRTPCVKVRLTSLPAESLLVCFWEDVFPCCYFCPQ